MKIELLSVTEMLICSICLTKSAKNHVKNDKVCIEKQQRTFTEIIQFCLCLQVSSAPNANTKMCNKCSKKLVSLYEFKKLAFKSDNYMKSFCAAEIKKNEETVKQEEIFINNSEPELEFDVFTIRTKPECEPKPDKLSLDIKYENESDDDLLWNIKMAKMEDSFRKTDIETTSKNKEESNKSIKEKKRQCEECGKCVVDLTKHMATHKAALGPDKFKYPCPDCDRKFVTHKGRKKHIKTIHLGIRSTCEICGKEVSAIRVHIATKHNRSQLQHACNMCDMKFFSPSLLKIHALTHSKEKKFECEICFKKYTSLNTLNVHRRGVHENERSHLCQYCSKAFHRKSHLIIHLRKHTNERPFSCDCGKSFKSSSALAQHRHIHSGEKNYVCDYCHMAFTTRTRLQAHILTHTKDKSFPCRYCSMRFGRSDHRNRHERTAHLKNLPSSATKSINLI